MSRWGFFASTNKIPTPMEIDIAKDKLKKTLSRLVKVADVLQSDPATRKRITDIYRVAAERLGVVRPWYEPVSEQKFCPVCQEPVSIRAVKHSCGAILNWNEAFRYALVTNEQYEHAIEEGWAE
jgi:hypothetical protein